MFEKKSVRREETMKREENRNRLLLSLASLASVNKKHQQIIPKLSFNFGYQNQAESSDKKLSFAIDKRET